ncbi:MAG: tyrosine-type recombinase/integrase [Bifidobacteriaceae bacterium]|jgi:integrase|nr:tyrosine-type recombinase/integrase [Bifidobacteriaceae bacterium]
MSRPRVPIGTFGEILLIHRASGSVEARARYRDWDGKLREVQATAKTEAAAERALKSKLAERSLLQPGAAAITPDSSFRELADYWFEDMELEGRVTRQTLDAYRRQMNNLVLPVFGNLTLREIGVARCDMFTKQLAKQSYSRAKQAKTVLRLAFALAVRHEVLLRNPMDGIGRLRKPPHAPDALTPQEVGAIRVAIRAWERGTVVSGPKPDGQLSAIIEVMLGTSARIGEALALRRRDVDIASAVPTVLIAGTIVTPSGQTPYRQDHPKTAKSRRVVALPSFTAEAVRARLADLADRSPDALVFRSRNGTPLTPNNVRRQLRRVLDLAGVERANPHKFRRTAATEISNAADADLAAELLGHTDSRTTIAHYIHRDEMVNPVTAALLDARFGRKA